MRSDSKLQPRQGVEINVTARQDQADALSLDLDPLLHHSGVRDRPGWLDDEFHRLPTRPHPGHDRLLAHRHDVIHVALDDREVYFSDIRAQSIRNRFLLYVGNEAALPE